MMQDGITWSAEYKAASKPAQKSALRRASDADTTSVAKVASASAKHPVVDCRRWPADTTTVMLRNIPNRYTQEDLLEELISAGFGESFDYFHLVMDMKTRRNKGFAFLNMRSPALAIQLHGCFHGTHLRHYRSQKVLEVALAEIQGFQANVISYLNAHGDRVQNVWFKPSIFMRVYGQWTAIPLTEANLPDEIAHVYGSHAKGVTRAEQRERMLAAAEAKVQQQQQESESGNEEDEKDFLCDGEYEEISWAVEQFLLEQCGGANKNPEAVLSALEKPRRKRRAKRITVKADALPVRNSCDGEGQNGCSILNIELDHDVRSDMGSMDGGAGIYAAPPGDVLSAAMCSSLLHAVPAHAMVPMSVLLPQGLRAPPGL